MDNNIAQLNGTVKLDDGVSVLSVLGTAGDWGLRDALSGTSQFNGYQYFIGKQLNAYMDGWRAGSALAQMATAEAAPQIDAVVEERTVGGVTFALRSTPSGYLIEESVLGDSFESEVYLSLTEAQFAFEVATGQQVAQSQDYGDDYGDGDPIGYCESTQPYLF